MCHVSCPRLLERATVRYLSITGALESALLDTTSQHSDDSRRPTSYVGRTEMSTSSGVAAGGRVARLGRRPPPSAHRRVSPLLLANNRRRLLKGPLACRVDSSLSRPRAVGISLLLEPPYVATHNPACDVI